jgi:ATP-dependent helicase YprA (DUF1998 family)
MDVFSLRDRVVGEYRDYVESFVNILDVKIEDFVRDRLQGGELWPEAVLQLNPAYEPGLTLGELASQGTIQDTTARFFGRSLRLHRHQQAALEAARRDEHYVVSTGTGSGKSLTYLVPIMDHVFRHVPERHTVRAIIVYPMNALINSQLDSLHRYRERHWPDCPVRVARYTGQERQEARETIIKDPPHILLTNYVMLEYMLIRPHERTLLQQATQELRFLVMDELHVYRGRQGADVAMLMRRVRQRAGAKHLQFVGTSATLATRGNRQERRARIAELASALFGVAVPLDNVVDESLQRVAQVPVPRTTEEVRAAVIAPAPQATPESIASHPLMAWMEEEFGLVEEEGRLVRRSPLTFAEGLGHLVEDSRQDKGRCSEALTAVLAAGNAVTLPWGAPAVAFRLHQFLASGSSVYATLEPPERHYLTTEGQYVAPPEGSGHQRLLFPLAFCRECGQEHYLAARHDAGQHRQLLPRSPLLNAPDDDVSGTLGFFLPERDDLWSVDEELPESWYEERKDGPRVKAKYQRHVPERCWVRPDGMVGDQPIEGAVEGWFHPRPLMLCLRCRAAYDLREKQDFRKLATLSQTGRSTATTITTSSAVVEMRHDGTIEAEGQKVLSFTDNRQDASLQAGHMNDFVQVALLRGALVRALKHQGSLRFEDLGSRIFAALEVSPERFMKEARDSGPGLGQAHETMVALLEYRAFEDLRRAWRVTLPNLEQCGLLRLDYEGLAALAADDASWAGVPAIADEDAERRRSILRAILDHLRGALALDAPCLTQERTRALVQRANQWLREPWAVDEYEQLRRSAIALLPGVTAAHTEQSSTLGLGSRSAVGRYLRTRRTWGRGRTANLSVEEVEELVTAIVARLRGHILTVIKHQGQDYAVQIKAGALRWQAGDGRAGGPDPVRTRALYLRRPELRSAEPNRYFSHLYQERAPYLSRVTGREHTGQVAIEDRIEREQDFKDGRLAALFCSPTMELGVDIADLNVVHMRNVPPTPANYAQRSGRAGRGGKPALVLAFCSQGSAHDQYFFRHKEAMIAGKVAPARLDLANRELVEAHLHSVWLSVVGLGLGSSLADLLALDSPPHHPLLPETAAQLEISDTRRHEIVEAFRQVVGSGGQSLPAASWCTDEWLAERVREAPLAFDRAMDRWRELYRAAVEQRDAARRKIDAPRLPKEERAAAKGREREALRELDLLLNQGEVTESDFYPYRYLANEGFLPGYNFPRLPLRALISSGETAQAIDRPRFLGLGEFGPQNVIYHEGRKHRVTSCVLPAGGLESRLSRARLCLTCGYIHPRDAALVDVCEHCHTALDAANSQFPQYLFDQPSVRVSRWARISSDEEERSREGYEITIHYRFAPGAAIRRLDLRAGGETLLEITLAPQTELWCINHGWRRSRHRNGFTIDGATGRWVPRPDDEIDESEAPDPAMQAPQNGVKPYVTDSRNVMLLRPRPGIPLPEPFLITLAYALQRGIQFVYQVEEHEVAVEPIGSGSHERLLLWEAAEGGTGVWERMLDDPRSFVDVAREALRICHFDPQTGEPDSDWNERCTRACYDCLLSYSNQREHRHIDRHLVRDYLLALMVAEAVQATGERTYDDQYRWLIERTDPASSFERAFLEHLYSHKLRLPDSAQHQPESDLPVQPDFYYHRDGLPGICIFVDGPRHDDPQRAAHDQSIREDLRDRGYRVVAIRHDRPLDEQIGQHPEVFGDM